MTNVEAACRQAVHRRDHHHDGPGCSDAVEAVSYGSGCFCICHDCEAETGILTPGEARAFARSHRCGS